MSNKSKKQACSNKRQRSADLNNALNELNMFSSNIFKNCGFFDTIIILSSIIKFSLDKKIEKARKANKSTITFLSGDISIDVCNYVVKTSINPFITQKKQTIKVSNMEYQKFMPSFKDSEHFRDDLLTYLKPCRYAMLLREYLFYDIYTLLDSPSPIMDKFYVSILKSEFIIQEEISTFAYITLTNLMQKISNIFCEKKIHLYSLIKFKFNNDMICKIETLENICNNCDIYEITSFFLNTENVRSLNSLITNLKVDYFWDLLVYIDDIYELIYTYI